MSGLYVDSGNMNAQGINTVANANDFLNEINVLVANVESLMNIWKGTAAESFKQSVDAQVVNLKEFEKILEILGEKIIEGAKDFDTTEDENAAAARNLF